MITSRSVLTVAVAAALCACVLAQVGPISDPFVNLVYDESAREQEQVVTVRRPRTTSESQIENGRYPFRYLPRHKGIRFGFEIVYDPSTVTTVMERVPSPSRSLQRLLSDSIRNQLPIDQFVMLFAQIVHAVDHCHRYKVVHGSITTVSILVTDDNSVKLSHPLLDCLRTRQPNQYAALDVDVYNLGTVLIRLLAVTVPSLPTQVQRDNLITTVVNLRLDQADGASSIVLHPVYLLVNSLLQDDRPALIVLHLARILDHEYGAGTDPYLTQILNIFSPLPIPPIEPEQIKALRLIAHMIDPDRSTRWSMDRIVQSYLVPTNP